MSSSAGGVLDMKALCIHVVFNMLTRSLLDTPPRTGSGGEGKSIMTGFDSESFLHAQNSSLREAVRMANNPLRKFMFWSAQRKEALKCRETLTRLGTDMLENYRDAIRGNEKWAETDQSIMGALVRHDYPSEEHRVSDLIIFLIAGHETTAMSLCFFLICLAQNPAVRRKLQQELDAILAPGEVASLAQVSGMEYFGWCYKEVQRLYPVAPVVGRLVTGADIHHRELVIPQNSIVAVNLYAMGRQKWIDRPLEFMPERWASNAPQVGELKDLLMPFSIGKRSCIGQNLAMMEMKVLAATLFRNFDMDLIGAVEEELFITLKPKDLLMKVTPRTR
jgi:cytochrome P450